MQQRMQSFLLTLLDCVWIYRFVVAKERVLNLIYFPLCGGSTDVCSFYSSHKKTRPRYFWHSSLEVGWSAAVTTGVAMGLLVCKKPPSHLHILAIASLLPQRQFLTFLEYCCSIWESFCCVSRGFELFRWYFVTPFEFLHFRRDGAFSSPQTALCTNGSRWARFEVGAFLGNRVRFVSIVSSLVFLPACCFLPWQFSTFGK